MQWYLQNIKGASARGELWGLLLFTAEWDASQKKKREIPPFLWSYLITHILSGALHATSCFMHNLWLLQSIFSITTCNTEVPRFQQSNYCTKSLLQPLIMQLILYIYMFVGHGDSQGKYWLAPRVNYCQDNELIACKTQFSHSPGLLSHLNCLIMSSKSFLLSAHTNVIMRQGNMKSNVYKC